MEKGLKKSKKNVPLDLANLKFLKKPGQTLLKKPTFLKKTLFFHSGNPTFLTFLAFFAVLGGFQGKFKKIGVWMSFYPAGVSRVIPVTKRLKILGG